MTDNDEYVEAPLGPRATLSRLMFEARESIEMWADSVEARIDGPDAYTRGLVDRIDAYRSAQGWSPHGFGGEDDDSLRSARNVDVPKT